MSVKHEFTMGLAVLIGLALAASPAYAAKRDKGTQPTAGQKVTLPDGAAKAVKDAFPNAVTGDVKMENEGGMLLYSVPLWEGAAHKTVMVSYDGTIAAIKTPSFSRHPPWSRYLPLRISNMVRPRALA